MIYYNIAYVSVERFLSSSIAASFIPFIIHRYSEPQLCIYMCMYIYIYIERERLCRCVCTHIYIYIYI